MRALSLGSSGHPEKSHDSQEEPNGICSEGISPEAEADHGQVMDQAHTPGTKKVDQMELTRIQQQLKPSMEKVNGPTVQAAWQKTLAESYEHQKPVAEKRPGLQREEGRGCRSILMLSFLDSH